MKNFDNPAKLSFLSLLEDLRPKMEISMEDIDILLRTSLSNAIKKSSLSRVQIAAKMSEILNVEITKSTLDSWTAASREGINRFPACYVLVFCQIVDSIEPLQILADKVGRFVIQWPEALDLEFKKKIEDQKKRLAEREKTLKTMRLGMRKRPSATP